MSTTTKLVCTSSGEVVSYKNTMAAFYYQDHKKTLVGTIGPTLQDFIMDLQETLMEQKGKSMEKDFHLQYTPPLIPTEEWKTIGARFPQGAPSFTLEVKVTPERVMGMLSEVTDQGCCKIVCLFFDEVLLPFDHPYPEIG